MTQGELLEQLVTLHAQHGDAHSSSAERTTLTG